MLASILLIFLFISIISFIVPEGSDGNWIHLILIVILFLFFGSNLSGLQWESPEVSSFEVAEFSVRPEQEAIHQAVRELVYASQGVEPLSVESDLIQGDQEYTLETISVVIPDGDVLEVQSEIERTFPGTEVHVDCRSRTD